MANREAMDRLAAAWAAAGMVVRRDEPMGERTWFGVGGPAAVWVEPAHQGTPASRHPRTTATTAPAAAGATPTPPRPPTPNHQPTPHPAAPPPPKPPPPPP
ncbi:MAG: hypothetical protein AAF842_08965, partial [Planctomycetota bacterium]